MENFKEIELILKNDKFNSNRLEKVELITLHKLFVNRSEIEGLNIYMSKHDKRFGNTLITFRSSNTKSIKENLDHYLTFKDRQEVQRTITSNNAIKHQLANLSILSLSDENLENVVNKNLALLAS
jgi:hypothetical protein